MINGDISNQKAPSMLFRVDGFLVKHRETTKLDKILNKVLGEDKRAELDFEVVNAIHRTFRNTDYYVGLVVLESHWTSYTKKLRDQLTDLPVGDIHIVHDTFEIYKTIHQEDYLYYVDNKENHALVGDNQSLDLETYINIINRRGR